MEDIIRIFTDSSPQLFISLFIRAFAVLFSFLYLLYAIVITRQTGEMNRTFTTRKAGLLFAVSAFQIPLGILLVIIAFVL